MRLAPILEIGQIKIADRGVPNKERIAIEFVLDAELAAYCLVFGVKTSPNGFIPFVNYFYPFPAEIVSAGSWVVVYTGVGEQRWTTLKKSGHPALALHWGFKQTLFANPRSTAAVLLLSGIKGAED